MEFISWVKVLYNGINSCVLNNGYFTEFFNLERGVRQGCPLSPYLFLLSVEVLGYAIRSNEQIKGIKLGDEICKLIQFADDMNCFVGDEASLSKLLILLDKFHRASGLEVNKDKSIAKYIGSLEGKQNNQINVKWEQGSISTLGIELCNTEKEMIDKNVRPKVKAMKSLLNVWSQRGFSLKGKITVINSLVIPKILYVASVIPIPAQFIYNIEKKLANFIWSGRKPKIKNSTLIAAIEDGGLNLVGLHSKIKATYIMWIQRCLKGSVHPIVSRLLLYYFKFNDSITLFNSRLEICKESDLPTFYQDLYKAWSQIKHKNL